MLSATENIQYGQYEVPNSETMACLNVGQPSNSYLPINQFNSAILAMTQKHNPGMLQYGKIPGYDTFRRDFANFLGNVYTNDYAKFAEKHCIEPKCVNVGSDELIMTNGNTGALQLLVSLFGETSITIFVEDPTYFLALDSFRDSKLIIKPINIDKHGLIVSELEAALHLEQGKRCLLYTIPINQNPTGYTMSEGRRMELASLATVYPNLLVFADEVYHMLNFSNVIDVFPMCYYHKNFISMGSFSKIFAPALRLGWIQSRNPDIISKIVGCGQLDSSGNMNPLGCAIAHELIKSGALAESVVKWNKFLSENCVTLYETITEILSEHIEFVNMPTGGYFLWVKFKPYVNTVELSTIMEKYGVKFHHGNKFSSSKNAENFMRLSFSWYCDKADYVRAIDRLKCLIDENTNSTVQLIKTPTKETKPTSVYVLGYKGRLGGLIVNQLNKSSLLAFGRGIDKDIDLTDVTVNSVIVDVSSPLGTEQLLTKLLNDKLYCSVVIGTTGILPTELIKQYSAFAPISVTSNFSKGINQMKKIFDVIEKDNWVASMLEKHHVHKRDAPSGTSKLLAKWYGTKFISEDDIVSVRQQEIVGEHHLTLNSENEFITVSHVAKSRELFAEGALEWVKFTVLQPVGLYDTIK